MILRDEQGEVEVGIGDLFQVKAATFSVICPEITVPATPVWVRLHAGVIEIEGRQVKLEDGKPAPVYLFPAALVASCMREHRLMTFDIPQTPVEPLAKAPRARTSKKRESQQEPISKGLFD
jgi:hypothetical protein